MFIRILIGVNTAIIFTTLVLYSKSVLANVPAGFEDLFEERPVNLKFILSADKNKSFSSPALASADSVKIQESQRHRIDDILKNKFGIDEKISEDIVNSLVNGVISSRECVGYRSECGLLPEFYDFVYVPDSQSLILHVNSNFIEENNDVVDLEFVQEKIDQNAIIMSHGLNLSGSYDEFGKYDSSYSYQHENHIGLGQYGYFHNDLNFSKVNGFSSDDSSYNYIKGDTRLSLGYKYQERAWNSTQYLENSSKTSGYMLSIGSTKELVKKSKAHSRRVYLNIPRAGRLEINDDRGRIILSKNVEAGQDFFNYNELPIGTYNATIRIFDGSEEFYSEERLIVNTGYDELKGGELDYHITAGFLSRGLTNTGLEKSETENSIYFSYDSYKTPLFTNGKLNYKLTDYLSIGGGSFITKSDHYNYFGGNLSLGATAQLSAVAGLFSDGSKFYNIDFGINSLSVSYTNFIRNSIDDDNLTLSQLLFNSSSYMSMSMNYNKYITKNISSYVSGIFTKNEYQDVNNSYNQFSRSWSARSGVQFSELPLDSKLNLEFSLSESNNINYGFLASISIPLSKNNTYTHSTQAQMKDGEDAILSHRDTIQSSIVNNENFNLSSSAGIYYQDSLTDNHSSDLSLSASYYNNHFETNAYAYINSNSSKNASAYIGTNNIITSEGVVFTKNKSSTYFISSNDTGKLSSKGKFLAVVNAEENGKQGGAYVTADELNIYPLNEYYEYSFKIDTEASDFYNDGDDNITATSYPGTVIMLNTSMSELKSFISTFSDINGKPINGVECVGVGCVSTDKLVEGVYQFKVKENLPYKIISKVNQCVIPELSSVKNLNLGNNFCMPSFEENNEGHQIALVDGIYYYYLGQYENTPEVIDYKNKLNRSGVDIISKDLGEYSYLFARSPKELTTAHKQYVNDLMNYAVYMEMTPYASN
ncbi:CS1-pili formation C-terminal domain-containing protein [Vibrio vulnificus]|uniref:CS1-pili formation C-terminal domain-containing protein n=1 Tax=Vibrio vulnificus TaxID=672 RepID=UPI001592D255|nr:CS1-pili formation C-terminal domain-containing protein [Vibrio vulnificus]EGQ8092881.1 hypothetical protein [Vibrio vulnificus]EHH0743574.1 hypothetical protein [Vibrio vulnificus]EJE8554840.1 CS1-pili formation C-terminal domain-containing protein [Vibrio vulnificus]NVD21397.1 hypothetical protein [Vibrio vulnificus]